MKVSKMAFKLSTSFVAHSSYYFNEKKVHLRVTQDDSVLSVSDQIKKFRRANISSNTFYPEEEIKVNILDHWHIDLFLYIGPSKDFPEGIIIAGCYGFMYVYKPGKSLPIFYISQSSEYRIRGDDDNDKPVFIQYINDDEDFCFKSLAKGTENNTFLTGANDETAKLWNITDMHASPTTFSHGSEVLGIIQLSDSNVVTAGWNAGMVMWSKNGEPLRLLANLEHVTEFIDFPELKRFASAGEAVIRFWSYSGDLIRILMGHTNHVCNLVRNKTGGADCFVSSDKDGIVRYWVNNINTEVIQLPEESRLDCLSNGDIVTKSSEGVVRIFTRDESRFADEQALNTYENRVFTCRKELHEKHEKRKGDYDYDDEEGRKVYWNNK